MLKFFNFRRIRKEVKIYTKLLQTLATTPEFDGSELLTRTAAEYPEYIAAIKGAEAFRLINERQKKKLLDYLSTNYPQVIHDGQSWRPL